ncbi:MAG: EAL domain-containing protein [Mariprofundus sp.]|nr:EAL domain-containing protein [Mariprofundus sp.]
MTHPPSSRSHTNSPTLNLPKKDGLDSVLVINDDPAMRELIEKSLQKAACNLITAANGPDGIALFKKHNPQLILADLQMSGMDGYTFCATLRALPGGEDVPIIVITSDADSNAIERTYSSGATDFIIKPIYWAVLHHRIQYHLRTHRAMHEARQSSILLAEAQRIAKLGNWIWDLDKQELHASDESYRIFDVPKVAPDIFHALFIRSVHKDDKKRFDIAVSNAHEGKSTDISFKIALPNKHIKTIQMHLDSSRGDHHIFGTFQDISEQRRTEASIRQLAYYDSITGLPNRDLFKEHLNMALHQAGRNHYQVAVMFLDLDNFKRVNDSLGHGAGDQLLHTISSRLQDSVRASDMAARDTSEMDISLARLGGDEFTIMLSCLHGIDHVNTVAQRILARITQPVTLGGNNIVISASIGIAIYPEDGDNMTTLLKNADAAMYKVKAEGRNGVFFYDQSMRHQSHDRLELESDLHKALDNDQLTLYYQPKVDTQSHKVIGFEALIRWIHPQKGIVSPIDFIPIAEESGLIVPIGQWVIQAACRQHQAWRKAGVPPVSIAVNLSAYQFADEHLLSGIKEIMQQTHMPAKYLELEITETVLMRDADSALHILNEMKAMGLKISIDDFGTGYSSISYLKHFPVDVLKIDREFVKDLPESEQDATITTAIIMLAKALNLRLVAEGVETVEQLNWLRDRYCDQIQGYFFSPPVPPEIAVKMITTPFPQGAIQSK